jgi:hypothetical protein
MNNTTIICQKQKKLKSNKIKVRNKSLQGLQHLEN